MKHLLKIIGQDISTLNSLIEHLSEKETLEPVEIDLALRKVNDIHNELLMLKPEGDKQRVSTNEPVVTRVQEEEKIVAKELLVELAIPEKVIEPEIIDEGFETKKAIVDPISIEEPAEVSPPIIESIQEEVQPIKVQEIEPEPKKVETKVVEQEMVKDEQEGLKGEPIVSEVEEAINERKLTSKSTIADKFGEAAPSLNDIQAGINKNKYLASQYKDKPIDKLSKAIKINDRIWFINELFSKDADQYAEVIKALDAKSNLDEALAYIFESYKWDQEKKSTISFLELVFRRFVQ